MRTAAANLHDFELVARRKSVAQWIENLTGVPVPTSSDYSFRSSLKDGVLLCKVMNQLVPYSVPKIVDIIDDGFGDGFVPEVCENIDSFLAAAEKFGMPGDSLFCVDDMLEGAWEERPKVAECLYQLQRKAEQLGIECEQDYAGYGHSMMPPASYYGSFGGCGSPGSPDPFADQLPGVTENFGQSEMMMNGNVVGGRDVKPKGVVNLVQQCTSILKERMVQDGVSSPGPMPGVPGPIPGVPGQMPGAPGPLPGAPTNSQPTPEGNGGLRGLEYMLKQILSGITEAQEKRGTNVEQLEKYVKSLEAQIELMNSMPQKLDPMYDGSVVPEDVERIQRTAEELSRKLDEYERINLDLEHSLEAEKNEKESLRGQLDELRRQLQSVDNIQEKYNKIQEENRKLYNQVQDLRGNIRVFCRVRPVGTTGDFSECCVDVGSDGELALGGKRDNDKRKLFTFDKVFDMSSKQDLVYSETQPLIRSVLDGYNVCIFAYGQTGSGKTHTMSGTNVEEYSGRGINYRSLDDLFGIKAARAEEFDYGIRVQMLEIYNEVLRDLLVEDSQGKNRLEIRNTEASGSNVPDAIQMSVNCTEDVLEFMEIGAKNRAVGGTKMNARSSRSHSIVTVIVDGLNRATGVRSHGCLHLVDLAGSERVSRSEASGERLEEAKHINKSLSALGDVMSALAQKSNHVPFRNSKLTQLLQDSLSGQAKAMMFMHVAPESSSRGETQSTLMFGARVSQITLGQARQNTESSKIFEARDAMTRLQQKAEKKQQEIEELHRVVESERIAKNTAITEKEAMEREISRLRAELETQRSLASTANSNASSVGVGHGRSNSTVSDSAPPASARKTARLRRINSSETPAKATSNERSLPSAKELLSRRVGGRTDRSSNSVRRDGSGSQRSLTSQQSGRMSTASRGSEGGSVRQLKRTASSGGARSGTTPSEKTKASSKTLKKSSSEKIRQTPSSESSLRKSLTNRDAAKKSSATANPRKTAHDRSPSISSISSNGPKPSARGSGCGGGWK